MSTKREELQKYLEEMHRLSHVVTLLYWDMRTCMPKGGFEKHADSVAYFSTKEFEMSVAEELGNLLDALMVPEEFEALNDTWKFIVKKMKRDFDKNKRIPADVFESYVRAQSEAEHCWEEAKNKSDFSIFAPKLQKIIELTKEITGYTDPEKDVYDALLNQYEEGLNMATLDAFFAQLREVIVPLIAKVQAAPAIEDGFLFRHYPVAVQRQLSDELMKVMGINRSHCGIAESEHPYTTNFNNKDVRITTHYHEDNLVSSMFSVIHEGGHALYELGADDCYNYTVLGGGVSMGIHESQSRFYENIIGRSQAFVHAVFPKIQQLFPEQLKDVDEAMFYRAINKAEPSLIRTEADELTYALHIMVRYEVEKQLIAGTLTINDVPKEWNRLYKEYLGIDVPNDTMGCLQDSHWSGGMIGYFPSYALGSAYGAQMLHKMEKDLGDIWTDVAKGDLSKVTGWLKDKIHRHASFIKPDELFRSVCGEFDAKYFTDYLTDKYTKLYELD